MVAHIQGSECIFLSEKGMTIPNGGVGNSHTPDLIGSLQSPSEDAT